MNSEKKILYVFLVEFFASLIIGFCMMLYFGQSFEEIIPLAITSVILSLLAIMMWGVLGLVKAGWLQISLVAFGNLILTIFFMIGIDFIFLYPFSIPVFYIWWISVSLGSTFYFIDKNKHSIMKGIIELISIIILYNGIVYLSGISIIVLEHEACQCESMSLPEGYHFSNKEIMDIKDQVGFGSIEYLDSRSGGLGSGLKPEVFIIIRKEGDNEDIQITHKLPLFGSNILIEGDHGEFYSFNYGVLSARNFVVTITYINGRINYRYEIHEIGGGIMISH